MATKKITEVDVVNSLSDSDAIFINSSNSLKQILKSNLVTKGEDGGYYAPAVDDEGNLSWKASKTNMPAVDGTNIKGPRGISGVYVGSGDMPEGYNVQIDPDGRPEELPTTLPNPSALTFTGAVTGIYDGSEPLTVNIPSGGGSADKKWKLIKTLNVSTDVAQEYFDTDDEGNSFSVQEIFITGIMPDIGTGYLFCRPAITGNVGNTQIWPTKGKYFKWYIGIYNNLLKTTLAISNNAIVGPQEKNVSCPERITGLAIGASSGYNEAGTIYVYGR